MAKGAPAFNRDRLDDPQAQRLQFGFNNDYTAFFPLKNNPDHGLLVVNHEYPIPDLMFAQNHLRRLSKNQAQTVLAAMGISVVEIVREKAGWKTVQDSAYNRRITALDTVITFSGPAAGHARLKTNADPTGLKVIGTLGNCAGGVTPWGTALSCEENINGFFAGKGQGGPEEQNHRTMGVIGGKRYVNLSEHEMRFSIDEEPNEPNRFGWVVEYDPYNPSKAPVKRTALGRFKHESASVTLNHDGRVVVYSGDDEAFQHIYKFVSKRPYYPAKPDPHLLDEGTLYAARFTEHQLEWLPLVFGYGALSLQNGFSSQADVLIEARRAAKLLGATEMDRPEDIEIHSKTGAVYIALTMNKERDHAGIANPRFPNPYGHIILLQPPKAGRKPDHVAQRFAWEPFILAGNPREPVDGAYYPNLPSEHGWLTNPDNLAIDGKGRLWVATDGQDNTIPADDSLYMVETEGPARGAPRHFFNAPIGAEVTGPSFTPDSKTLFISVQHPGEGSPGDNPNTRWPDHRPDTPPRPTVVAITKNDGGIIGG